MPYQIPFTDLINKGTITVEDREINTTDTSLKFPGRGSTGYGNSVAENFLHLLENFANNTPPDNPVEGQTWYDTNVGVDQLKIYDGTNWISASGIRKSPNQPDVSTSLTGDLWVDTDNQQLYLNSGAGWILVGPEFSQGLATGTRAETVIGSDEVNYTVLIVEIEDVNIACISANDFTPKNLSGFGEIKKGFNLNRNLDLRYNGVAEAAAALRVGNTNIDSSNFLRGDVTSTSTNLLRVRNNRGIDVGDNSQLTLQANGDIAVVRSNFTGSSLDLVVKNGTTYETAVRVKSDKKVGVNVLNPQETLDVGGNTKISGHLLVANTDESNALDEGSIQTAGGAAISKNLNVGGNVGITQNLDVTGDISTSGTILGTGDIGALEQPFDTVYASNFVGSFQGTITGAATSAGKLTNRTRFEMAGDVTADPVLFDGSGELTKTFDVQISNQFVTNKPNVTIPADGDELLINRITNTSEGPAGLYKISQRNFLRQIANQLTPVGLISPYGGEVPPDGWLLCDGREIQKAESFELWQTIGHKFKDPAQLSNPSATHFALPDFRGRFPLGADNMGGAAANRVSDLAADRVGNAGGAETKDIRKDHLPDHDHDMRSEGNNPKQFYGISASNADAGETPLNIQQGQASTSGIPTSGGIKDGGTDGAGNFRDPSGQRLGTALEVMNPYQTVNYIIYAGGE